MVVGTTKAFLLGKEIRFSDDSSSDIIYANTVKVSDNVSQLLSLSSGSDNVDNALIELAKQSISSLGYLAAITVVDYLGNPLSGVTISGVTNIKGGTAVTNADGYVLGMTNELAPTISTRNPFIDLSSASSTLDMSSATIVKCTLTLQKLSSTSKRFTSSTNGIRISPAVSVLKVCCVGAGGGGGGGYRAHYGPGDNEYFNGGDGGDGYTVINENVSFNYSTLYDITIGNAGSAGKNATESNASDNTAGGRGGNTSAIGVTASGGSGGRPARSGADGNNGSGSSTAPNIFGATTSSYGVGGTRGAAGGSSPTAGKKGVAELRWIYKG